MAFTRRMKCVFITAEFFIGASGASFTFAPKRTGKNTFSRCFISRAIVFLTFINIFKSIMTDHDLL